MTRQVRIAVLQAAFGEDMARNIKTVDRLVREAHALVIERYSWATATRIVRRAMLELGAVACNP